MTIQARLLSFVDRDICGQNNVPWSLASFTAGFLQEMIKSDKFFHHDEETREKIRMLSFVAHLVVRSLDFNRVYQQVSPLLEDLSEGITSWEDPSFFVQWRQDMLDKTKISVKSDHDDDDDDYDMHDDADCFDDEEDVNMKEEEKFVKEEVGDVDEEDNVKDDAKLLQITKKNGKRIRIRKPLTQEQKEKQKLRVKKAKMCTECGLEFKDLSHHMRNNHNITWYKCDIPNCNYSAKHEYELKRHLTRAHTDDQVTTCPYCGETTRNLRSHLNNKKCDQPELAQQLKEEKERIKEEKVKAKVTKPEKSKTCPVCEKEFPLRKTMLYHYRYKHLGTKFKCSYDGCNFEATTSSSRNRHENTVHKGERFYCDQCSFNTGQAYALTQHMATHNGMVFPCDECGLQSKSQAALRLHIKSAHLGIKYQCDQCDYICKHPSNLTKHIQFRHEGRTYRCDICGIEMATTSGLKNHINQQHGGMKFNCEQCDYQAQSRSRLKEHVVAKHDERVFQHCQFCKYKSKAPRRFQEHMKKHETAILC